MWVTPQECFSGEMIGALSLDSLQSLGGMRSLMLNLSSGVLWRCLLRNNLIRLESLF